MLTENQIHFSTNTKKTAFEKVGKKCEKCLTEYRQYDELTYHHKYIWQYEAHYFAIRGQFVASSANVEVLCPCCHAQLHKQKSVRPTEELVDGILTVGEMLQETETARELVTQVMFYYLLYQSFYES